MNIKSILVLVLFLTSCSTQRLITDKKYYKSTYPTYTQVDHFIFWGIGQKKIFDKADSICQKKDKILSSVEFKQTVPNYLLTLITLGIYSPRTLEIHCIKK